MVLVTTGESTAEFAAAAPAWAGERELVAELRAGSEAAFNYLIAVHHQPLYQLLLRMLGDPEDAAEALQEVFLKIFRAAAGFKGESSLKTWVYRVAAHEASNRRRWWRRHKRQETPLDTPDVTGFSWADRLRDAGASPLSLAMRGEARRRLLAALGDLPAPYRVVVLLREVEGFGYDEIASILGLRGGTVKSRLKRGREILRRRLLAEPELCRELGVASAAGSAAVSAGVPPAAARAALPRAAAGPFETPPRGSLTAAPTGGKA